MIRELGRMPRSGGVTLIELLIVITIIGLLTTAALKAYDTSLQTARIRSTMNTLDALSAAIVGNPDLVTNGVRTDFGYVGDVGAIPNQLGDLVTAPTTIDTGLWHGPYVVPRIAENPASYEIDAWGDSLIYSIDSLSISSRRGLSILQTSSWITRTLAPSAAALFHNRLGGIIYDSKGNSPDPTRDSIVITLEYPQDGHLVPDPIPLGSNGNFRSGDNVTVGNHRLTVRYIVHHASPPDDTFLVAKNVSIMPGAGDRNWAEIHMPVPFRR